MAGGKFFPRGFPAGSPRHCQNLPAKSAPQVAVPFRRNPGAFSLTHPHPQSPRNNGFQPRKKNHRNRHGLRLWIPLSIQSDIPKNEWDVSRTGTDVARLIPAIHQQKTTAAPWRVFRGSRLFTGTERRTLVPSVWNLICHRKGRCPNIMFISAEPTPSRLSALAWGPTKQAR